MATRPELIDMRTDGRLTEWWRRRSPLVEAMAELLDRDHPPLLATKCARLIKYNGPRRKVAQIQQQVSDCLKLAESIRDDGFDFEFPIVLSRCSDGALSVRDGAHRACILLVLGEQVLGELPPELPRFDPLQRFPLRRR